jgi:hypothetical protein
MSESERVGVSDDRVGVEPKLKAGEVEAARGTGSSGRL